MRRCGIALRLRREQGAELIEFALVLPVLLVLLAAILDFGFLFKNWEVVTNAAREGARMAALPGWVESDVETRVNNYLTAGGLQGTAVTSVDPVTVAVGTGSINGIKVTVEYPHSYMILGPIVALLPGGSVGDITLKAAATMRTEAAAGL
jgi:Flp pilus assembly protein TadG